MVKCVQTHRRYMMQTLPRLPGQKCDRVQRVTRGQSPIQLFDHRRDTMRFLFPEHQTGWRRFEPLPEIDERTDRQVDRYRVADMSLFLRPRNAISVLLLAKSSRVRILVLAIWLTQQVWKPLSQHCHMMR